METKDTKLSIALKEFRDKYPNTTSGDLQSFILGWQAYQEMNKDKLFTIEQVKNIIFKARILTSDWADTFISLDEKAAEQQYNPSFKYEEQEIIQQFLTEPDC